MPKPWLRKTVGNKGWLLTKDSGEVEFIETKAKLKEKLKEYGLEGKRCPSLERRRKTAKSKYTVEIRNNGLTVFSIGEVSEETMWALHDLAAALHSQDGSLFTEFNVSKD